MALPLVATIAAMEVRLGGTPLAGADLARATANLEDVSALIRVAASSDLVEEDGVTLDAPAAVVAVAIQAALRAFRNPEGIQSFSVEGYSEQQPQGDSLGVYLSDDESAIIRAAMNRTAGGTLAMGSVRTPSAYADPATDDLSFWGLA